jgi:hypothetical protein
MAEVDILVHRHDSFSEEYLLYEVMRHWRHRGVRISVQCGPIVRRPADLAVLHVDLTVVDGESVVASRFYPRVVNGNVTDISKRRISRNLVMHGDGYDGAVIVKTDRNARGVREARLQWLRSGPWARGQSDDQMIASRWAYRIFRSPADVPEAVWRNRLLVVERFLPERRNGLFCLRTWQFLGDRELNAVSTSYDPIVKSRNVLHTEPAAVPDEIREIRENLRFDFGKFDYAMVDGRVVLYDANRTPTIGPHPSERYLKLIADLAEGLGTYL